VTFVGRAEAHDACVSRAEPPIAAVTVVAGLGVVLGSGVDQLARAVAPVRPPLVEQPLSRGAVQLEPTRLPHGPLVPVEAEPTQRARDTVDEVFARTGGVGVLDAQDEGAS